MKRNYLIGLTVLLVLDVGAQPAELPSAARQAELIRLVRQDCGSCHGMTLKGGLGSPLLPESLRDKPSSSLVATVLYGRPDTAMPAWNSVLSESDAEWIVARLIAGFPHE